jgi:RNA polymerase-binding transcription factor DksA
VVDGMTAVKETVQAFAKRRLLERRRDLLARSRHADESAQELLEEREPDWEDRAAHLRDAYDLEHLGENERAQLARVQLALERLAEGTWGTCLVCDRPISQPRLRAVPEATRCARCVRQP